jgi:hypothetical protein
MPVWVNSFLPSLILLFIGGYYSVILARRERKQKETDDKRERCQELLMIKVEALVHTVVEHFANGARDAFKAKYDSLLEERKYEHGK